MAERTDTKSRLEVGFSIATEARRLAAELAEAVAKDETPEEGGCDISAGLFGVHASNWLRKVAAELLKGKP